MLPVSANYTVDAIGMIAVMTGWLSQAFRAVFLSVHFAIGDNQGIFVCACMFSCIYHGLRACTCTVYFPQMPTNIHVGDYTEVAPCGIFHNEGTYFISQLRNCPI